MTEPHNEPHTPGPAPAADASAAGPAAGPAQEGPPVSFGKPDAGEGVDWRVRWQAARARAAGLAREWSPPDLWSHGRPSLGQVWAYATAGEWTGPDGTVRTAGRAYAVAVAMPVIALAYLIAWTAERPSRLAAAALLLFVFAQVPPLAWLTAWLT